MTAQTASPGGRLPSPPHGDPARAGSGLLLMPADLVAADKAGWLARRTQGVTGTDIAAAMGLSAHAGPFSLYHAKRDGIETDDKPVMARGRILEPVIDDELHRRRPELSAVPAGLFTNSARPWTLATIDRLILDTDLASAGAAQAWANGDPAGFGWHGDAVSVGEYKTWATKDGWGDPPDGIMPVSVRAQAIWNGAVFGAALVRVVVLWMVPWEVGVFDLPMDRPDVQRDLRVMLDEGWRFHQRVLAGDEPDPDERPSTTETLRKLHPDLVDDEVILPRWLSLKYYRARAAKARAEARVKLAQNLIRHRMGNRARAMAWADTDRGRRLVKVCSRSIGDHPVKAHTRHDDKLNPGRWAP